MLLLPLGRLGAIYLLSGSLIGQAGGPWLMVVFTDYVPAAEFAAR